MTKKRQAVKKGLLPLVVGVTGHRDLVADDVPSIVNEVRTLFDNLHDTYPHTPIILLSSLAEGADRLVAHTALNCGAELYAVLPMQADWYEQDFQSTDSLEEFRQLLSRSYDAGIISMPHERDAEAAHVPGPARDRRYASAGAFLVSHSQIVIALWDGDRDEMIGGTSQIVRFALRGVPARYLTGPTEPLRANETGAVYHVRVRRQSGKSKLDSPASAAWLYPVAESPEAAAVKAARAAFQENLRSLERFNRDAVTQSIEHQASRSAKQLLPSKREASLNINGILLKYTRSLFGQADALALLCRDWTHTSMIAIFGAIGVAAVLFSLYTNELPNRPVLYVAFIGVVAVAFGVNLIIARRRLQDRFQDYRALAEGLRVQFYWRLAGIRESVYDHYLARQAGELNWIRNAMRAALFRRQVEPNATMGNDETQALLEIVLVQWINDQEAYFSKAIQKERTMATRIKSGANACLVATGAIGIVLAAAIAAHSSAYHGALVTALTLALAGAGLFTGYAQKRAHEEHARRYQHMHVLYKIAGERVGLLLREHDLAAARAVFLQLGREALAETCDWLLLHRERQIVVPTA